MANIYANPNGVVLPLKSDPQQNKGNGDSDFQKYLAQLSPEERQAALEDITKPITGEEVAQRMASDPNYDPNKEDWIKLNAYHKNKESDMLETLFNGIQGIGGEFAKAGEFIIEHPLDSTIKIPANVVESFAQSSRGLYGIIAQSQDSTSPQNRFSNWINGRSTDSDGAYAAFLDARNFNRESEAMHRGEKTMVMDKDLINPEIVAVGQYIADPTWLLPMLKGAVGLGHVSLLGERAMGAMTRASALKDAVIGGTIKWGVGAPIEFIGNATRNTIDFGIDRAAGAFEVATGMSAKEAAGAIRLSSVGFTGAGAFGSAVPYATEVSGAYMAGRAMAGTGEAIGLIGNRIMKGERGILSYASQAIKDTEQMGIALNPHTKSLLKVINAFDPVMSYAGNMLEGGLMGAGFGGALGWWNAGEEGFAGGVGAGLALGAMGGLTGKTISDISGKTRLERTAVTAQMVMNGLKETNPSQYANWNALRVIGKKTGVNYDGIIASLDRLAPKAELFYRSEAGHAEYLLSKGLDPNTYKGDIFLPNGDKPLSKDQFTRTQGFVVEKKATGEVQIHINLDKMTNNTVGHELFHGIMRTTILKDSYVTMLKDHILGSKDLNGNVINSPSVAPNEVKQMFKRYIDAEHRKGTPEHADAINRLDAAIKMFEKDGTLAPDKELGRPFLEHMAEEFGAYYFTHWLKSKPIDYLFYETNLPGIRGVMENIKNSWLDYWQGRMESSDPSIKPQFDFNRTYLDKASGTRKLVPINEVFSPVGTGRVRVSALDYFMKDFIQATMATNRQQMFDINSFGRESQARFIRGQGLDGTFIKGNDGNYRFSTESEINRENAIKGKAVYKILKSMKPEDRTSVIDAEGNITGFLSDKELQAVVQAGHMSQELANKIKMAQAILTTDGMGNVIDFGGIGKSAEKGVSGEGRLYGSKVPFKIRTGILFGLEIKISENGKFSFKGNMLDQKVIEQRANNIWQNPEVQKLWGGNHTDFMTDFYRYLENASKNPNDPNSGRVPSAELWTDGQGAERRNALHQVLGLAKSDGDVFLNAPTAEIARGVESSVFSFNLNRMTNMRVRDTRVPYKHENAYHDLVRNWQPSEMPSEQTPSGSILKHISGYKFIYNKETNKTDAFNEVGEKIGTYDSKEKAVKAGQEDARQHSGVLSRSYMPAEEAAGEGGRVYNKTSREWNAGFIGRQAGLNPDLIKGKNIKFTFNEGGEVLVSGNTYRRTPSYRVDITDSNGAPIGHISVMSSNNGRNTKTGILVERQYRNQGYGKILLSEMAERLRADKVETLGGYVLNQDAIPVKLREKVLGEVIDEFGDTITQKEAKEIIQEKTAESGWQSGIQVNNKLEQTKYYQPAEENAGEAGAKRKLSTLKGTVMDTTYENSFTPLDKKTTPDPDKHNLWQFLNWTKRNGNGTVEFGKALGFLAKQKDRYSSTNAEWLLAMIKGTKWENYKLELTGNNVRSSARIGDSTRLGINPLNRKSQGDGINKYNESKGYTMAEIMDSLVGKNEKEMQQIANTNWGRGFEGTMLEEIMHQIQSEIVTSKDLQMYYSNVQGLMYNNTPAFEGRNWAAKSVAFVKQVENHLANPPKPNDTSRINVPNGKDWTNGVPHDAIILAKILKLHKHSLDNIFISNVDGSPDMTLWQYFDKFDKFGKGDSASWLKKGFYFKEQGAVNKFTSQFARAQDTYRFQDPAEFLVSIVNSKTTIEHLSNLPPVDMGILDKYSKPLMPNAKNLLEQVTSLIADFFGFKRNNKSALTQLIDLTHEIQTRGREKFAKGDDISAMDLGVQDDPSNIPPPKTEPPKTEPPKTEPPKTEPPKTTSTKSGTRDVQIDENNSFQITTHGNGEETFRNESGQKVQIVWMDKAGKIVPRFTRTGKANKFDPNEHRVVLVQMVQLKNGWHINDNVVPHVMDLDVPESSYHNFEFRDTFKSSDRNFSWWDSENNSPKNQAQIDYDYKLKDSEKVQEGEVQGVGRTGFKFGTNKEGFVTVPPKPKPIPVDPNNFTTGDYNAPPATVTPPPLDTTKPPSGTPPPDGTPLPDTTPPSDGTLPPPSGTPPPSDTPPPSGTQKPPKGKPRPSTQGTGTPAQSANDIRMWRSWTSNTNPNGKTWSNQMGFVIVQTAGSKFRLYNPMKTLIGVYNRQEEAEKKVMKLEPR